MYDLSEAIAVKNGVIINPDGHEARYQRSYEEFYGHKPLHKLFEKSDIVLPGNGYYKMRISYNETEKFTEIIPYKTKTINTLKLVETTKIDYHLKYSNRIKIDKLLALRDKCDDIIIINDGFVSDSSSGNVIFLKNDQWFTPDSPLLKGTQRAKLLRNGTIKLKTIKKENIKEYESIQIINALRPFKLSAQIPVQNIKF